MEAVDQYIPEPQRSLDKPFLLPIEDVFSIQVLYYDQIVLTDLPKLLCGWVLVVLPPKALLNYHPMQ